MSAAPGGRFLEIGKRDLMLSANLDMSGFLQNQLYAGVDVGGLVLSSSSRFSRWEFNSVLVPL